MVECDLWANELSFSEARLAYWNSDLLLDDFRLSCDHTRVVNYVQKCALNDLFAPEVPDST